jgi:glycine cleavage system H protein
MSFPKEYFYTKTHEYAKIEGKIAYVGLTSFAAEQLGDIVFVELPDIGKAVKQNTVFGVVESVKAVSDCYCPVSGKVVKVNEKLVDAPETLNADPHGAGWIMAVEMADTAELKNLLDGATYDAMPKETH